MIHNIERERVRKLLADKKLREMDKDERALIANAALAWVHVTEAAEAKAQRAEVGATDPDAHIVDISEADFGNMNTRIVTLTTTAGPCPAGTPLYKRIP